MGYLDDYLKRAHYNKEGREKRRRIRLPDPADEARRRQLEEDLDYYYIESERNMQMGQWDQAEAAGGKARQVEQELNRLLSRYGAFDKW